MKKQVEKTSQELREDNIVKVLNTHRIKLTYTKPENGGGLIATCACGWQSKKVWKIPLGWHDDDPDRHACWVTAFKHLANMMIEEGKI